jgi:hypothetical protein
MEQEAETSETPQAEETPEYKLSLKGEGVSVERDVTKEVALAVINVALGGRPAVGAAATHTCVTARRRTGSPAELGAGEAERVTPGEYIEHRNARTNPEKITAFGVYLRETRDQETFTREDIKGMFRAAHETAPANFGRDFRAALTSRWIASEEGSTDRYWVTGTGQRAVAEQFATPRRPRRRAARATSGGDEDQ